MKANIVLGLGFGDEGKGITTDYLCSQNLSTKKVVVRFSGGQQAGHTVIVNGKKHIFSSFGSGTLRNVPTYISEYCSFDPLVMYNELNVLHKLGVFPPFTIHPLAKVTTPMDVVYNKIIEKVNRHGSCGLGVGATMKRHIETPYKLYAIDLFHEDIFYEKLDSIYNFYLNLLPEEEKSSFAREYVERMFYYDEAIQELPKFPIRGYDFLYKYDEIIFEGSQGILLDMDHGIFPNVTYANTTSKNALQICKKIGCYDITTYYVTRCYQTRHGNGWMSNNTPIQLINNAEEINKENEWQGPFKIGELDYSLINYSYHIDDIYNKKSIKNVVITCLDQRPDFKLNPSELYLFSEILTSHSPDSKDFKIINI